MAKELLAAARSGDTNSVDRLATCPRIQKHTAAGSKPDYALADAQYVVARDHGFSSWPLLVEYVKANRGGGPGNESAMTGRPHLIRPPELTGDKPLALADGDTVSSDEVWAMFQAALHGDLGVASRLLGQHPALADHRYNYTPPIHFAVREGHLDVVRLLIRHGAVFTDRTYPFGDSLFTMARDRGHHLIAGELERELLRRFPNVVEGPAINHFLDRARANDFSAVVAALEADPSLARASNDTGDTALHQASERENYHVFEALLDAGADPDAVRADGYRPIHCLLLGHHGRSRPGSEEMVRQLLERGAHYSAFVATMLGESADVRAMVAADPTAANAEDTCHHRPLSAAVRRRDHDLVAFLLDHGADPNAPEEGAPKGLALWLATYGKLSNIARTLLSHGADPYADVDSSGPPVMHARRDEVMRAVYLSLGVDEVQNEPNPFETMVKAGELELAEAYMAVHPGEATADVLTDLLADACNSNRVHMAELLLQHGARVPDVSKWGRYYYFEHDEPTRVLMEHGVNPDHRNWNNVTVLHQLARDGIVSRAEILLDHGADIEAIDDEYRSTPLGFAVRWGQRPMVAMLLERGADPNGSGAPWSRPLVWARRKGWPEIEAELLAAGANAIGDGNDP